MVKVYVTDIFELPDPKECPEILAGLPDARVQKTLRYRQLKDRKQSFGAGLLLKKCLEEYHINIEDIRYGKHGKPEIEGIYFNLSHSHDMVVLAVSNRPIGCDIEKVGKIRDGIAKHYFTDNEVRYLEQYDGDKKREEFYHLWTMKESYMKMTGEGSSLSLKSFEFEIRDNVKVYRDGNLCDCYIKEYEIPGYKLTVCSEEYDFKDETICVDLLNGICG